MGNRGAAVHAAVLELFEVIAVMLAKSKSLWFCHGTEIELSLAVFIRKYMIKLTPRILLDVSVNFCAAIQVFGIELQAKLLNYFLGSNKSNINKDTTLVSEVVASVWIFWDVAMACVCKALSESHPNLCSLCNELASLSEYLELLRDKLRRWTISTVQSSSGKVELLK